MCTDHLLLPSQQQKTLFTCFKFKLKRELFYEMFLLLAMAACLFAYFFIFAHETLFSFLWMILQMFDLTDDDD